MHSKRRSIVFLRLMAQRRSDSVSDSETGYSSGRRVAADPRAALSGAQVIELEGFCGGIECETRIPAI